MSQLSLKEMCTISNDNEGLQPFCIQSAANGTFSILSRFCVNILTPKFKFTTPINFFYLDSKTITCPLSMPTNEFDTNEVEIYNSADAMKKQDLLLDPRFMPKLSNVPVNQLVQSRACSWSNMNNEGKCMLAYLSSFGGLEIFYDEKKVIDVSDSWSKTVMSNLCFPLKTVNDLESAVEDVLFTATCWNSDIHESSIYQLICTTRSNKCVMFRFQMDLKEKEAKQFDLGCVSDLPQNHILCLKWGQNYREAEKQWFVAGSQDGKICLYSVETDGKVSLKTMLWDEEDQFATSSLEMHAHFDRTIIIAIKGGHFLVFLVDKKLNVIAQDYDVISNQPITGLLHLNRTEFLVTSLNSVVKKVMIQFTPQNCIKLQTDNIAVDFSVNGYSTYGIAASINKAFILIVSYATQSFDHLVLRQPLTLHICRLSDIEPFKKLFTISTKSLKKNQDIAEVVRYIAAKDIKNLKEFEQTLSITENIGFTKDFQYRIKVATLLAGARYTYYRLRSQAETEATCNRLKSLAQIIEAVNAYEVLKQFHEKATTTFQLLSAKCLRLYLLDYMQQSPEIEEFKIIYDFFKIYFTELIFATSRFNEIPNEICAYCDLPLPLDGLICEQKHITTRCCISKVQVSLIACKICVQCDKSAWSDMDDLMSILRIDIKNVLCPLCDIPMISS